MSPDDLLRFPAPISLEFPVEADFPFALEWYPAWLSDNDHIVTWALTRTATTSAIEHRTRDGTPSREQRRETLRRFDALTESWDEITDVLAVRLRANAILARHPLRAAGAGRLDAALSVQEQMAGVLTFVCLDASLALAAEREQPAITL